MMKPGKQGQVIISRKHHRRQHHGSMMHWAAWPVALQIQHQLLQGKLTQAGSQDSCALIALVALVLSGF